MFRQVADAILGDKLDERQINLEKIKLKVILKERQGRKFVLLGFVAMGSRTYNVLEKEHVGQLIDILSEIHEQL